MTKSNLITSALLAIITLITIPSCTTNTKTKTHISNNDQDPLSPKGVTRRALLAIFSNNKKLLQETTWPAPNATDVLVVNTPNQQQLKLLKQRINNINLASHNIPTSMQSDQILTKHQNKPLHFTINFNRRQIPLALLYKNKQWKIDLRWFIASFTPENKKTYPQLLCARFLKALLLSHIDRVKAFSIPNKYINVLASPKAKYYTPDKINQISNLAESMPFVQLKPGEYYQNYEKNWVKAPINNQNHIVLIGRTQTETLPFQLYRTKYNKAWLIDPTPLIKNRK